MEGIRFIDAVRAALLIVAFFAVLVIGGMALTGTLGTTWNTINAELFNSSPEHQQGVATELTNDCVQMTADNRQMMEAKIRQDASGVDVQNIPMDQTVRDCVEQAFKDASNN